MEKHTGYNTVKNLIAGGYVKSFQDMVDPLPKSVIARDLGMNYTRISRLMNNPTRFSFEEVFRFAELLEVDDMVLITMVLQYKKGKKGKK